jgi:hypothetical protein
MTLKSQLVLARVLGAESRFVEGEKVSREAVEKASRVLGPQHPITLDIELNLALNLLSQQQFPEAESLGRKVMNSSEKCSASNIIFVNSMMLVGRIHLAQGHLEKARLLFEKAKEEVMISCGEEHLITKAILNDYAMLVSNVL